MSTPLPQTRDDEIMLEYHQWYLKRDFESAAAVLERELPASAGSFRFLMLGCLEHLAVMRKDLGAAQRWLAEGLLCLPASPKPRVRLAAFNLRYLRDVAACREQLSAAAALDPHGTCTQSIEALHAEVEILAGNWESAAAHLVGSLDGHDWWLTSLMPRTLPHRFLAAGRLETCMAFITKLKEVLESGRAPFEPRQAQAYRERVRGMGEEIPLFEEAVRAKARRNPGA